MFNYNHEPVCSISVGTQIAGSTPMSMFTPIPGCMYLGIGVNPDIVVHPDVGTYPDIGAYPGAGVLLSAPMSKYTQILG
jgi:hypothetical protein